MISAMLDVLIALLLMIRVIPSPTVPGILDLQRLHDGQWETYNNIALLVEANGVWNSAELDGGTITEASPGVYDYATLPNGAHVQVSIEPKYKGVRATATVLAGNVTKLALSNDYGLADQVRSVGELDALALPEPRDGIGISGDFYPLPVGPLTLRGDNLTQYQRAEGATEAWAEVRRHPWLPSQPDPGHNWIERAHLTRSGGGDWYFGWQ